MIDANTNFLTVNATAKLIYAKLNEKYAYQSRGAFSSFERIVM
jgi:hypothetical protein